MRTTVTDALICISQAVADAPAREGPWRGEDLRSLTGLYPRYARFIVGEFTPDAYSPSSITGVRQEMRHRDLALCEHKLGRAWLSRFSRNETQPP